MAKDKKSYNKKLFWEYVHYIFRGGNSRLGLEADQAHRRAEYTAEAAFGERKLKTIYFSLSYISSSVHTTCALPPDSSSVAHTLSLRK